MFIIPVVYYLELTSSSVTDTGNTSVAVQLLCLPCEHSYFLKLVTHLPIKISCNIFESNFVKVMLVRIFLLLCCYFSTTLSSVHGKKINLGF